MSSAGVSLNHTDQFIGDHAASASDLFAGMICPSQEVFC